MTNESTMLANQELRVRGMVVLMLEQIRLRKISLGSYCIKPGPRHTVPLLQPSSCLTYDEESDSARPSNTYNGIVGTCGVLRGAPTEQPSAS